MMLHKNLAILYLNVAWFFLAVSDNEERMQAEWVEIANDLTPAECRRLLAALRVVTFELPEDVLGSPDDQPRVQSSDDCLSRLRAWRHGEGRQVDWPHIALRLREINRPDVAERISDEVADVRQHDVNNLFLSNPFHDMIKHHRSSFLVEHGGDKAAPHGQRDVMSARRKRHLYWRLRPWHIGRHAVKYAPQAEKAKKRKKKHESAWLVAMVVVPCAVVAMTTVLLGILWAYMYWKHGKHFRLRWIFSLTRNDMKLYRQRRRSRRVSRKTSRNEVVRMKQDPIFEPLEDQVYPGCISVQAVSDMSADASMDVGTINPVALATDTMPLFGEKDFSDNVTGSKRRRSKDSVICDETRTTEKPSIPPLHLPPEDAGNESGVWMCPSHDSTDECPICQYLVTSVNVTDSLSSLSPSPSESSLTSLPSRWDVHSVGV
ncbi:uncharacterized protein [Branchiostoma lanceolatum]|uniref:uncharacterized protein isoform X1 n=2 Tax=Branchiostoma lanceolatum TaxID=7740 RepID=UPI0034511490